MSTLFKSIEGEEVLTRNKFVYSCTWVRENIALIHGTRLDVPMEVFEVWKLRTTHENDKHPNKWGVSFPSNNNFGYYGWSYDTLEAATKKFDSLVNEAKE